jgi:hypothetical protein
MDALVSAALHEIAVEAAQGEFMRYAKTCFQFIVHIRV